MNAIVGKTVTHSWPLYDNHGAFIKRSVPVTGQVVACAIDHEGDFNLLIQRSNGRLVGVSVEYCQVVPEAEDHPDG